MYFGWPSRSFGGETQTAIYEMGVAFYNLANQLDVVYYLLLLEIHV